MSQFWQKTLIYKTDPIESTDETVPMESIDKIVLIECTNETIPIEVMNLGHVVDKVFQFICHYCNLTDI